MGLFNRLSSEIAYLRGALRVLKRVSPVARTPTVTICDLMADAAARYGDKIALISDKETLTFRDYDGIANRYARWARARGIGKGDTVALLMPNRAEYLAIWLGVARAGGVTALLNTNLSGSGLAHCITIVDAKLAIVARELLPAYSSAVPFMREAPGLWVHGDPGLVEAERIDTVLPGFSDAPLDPSEKAPLTIEDRCLFVYTSGTTGLPKAANINHYRVRAMAVGFSAVMDVSADDRIYDCLPMYHSNGGILATCGVLCRGGTVVIRERFSAREFWSEIIRYECTLFFYIGELCRYLLNSEPSPQDRAHRIRLICGNGLRPDIWTEFVKRFGISKIREFYAATEGNIALFNFDGRPGAVGRIPKWAEKRFVVKIVRFDLDGEQPVRGTDGFCIACPSGEIGEIVGQILNDPEKPANRFEGYADKTATEKKILRDAFEKGDAWFRSGDLLKRDADGYYYFIDRIGDTFRWKGENVATSEVSEAITVYPGIAECNVYGVAVPGYDGRAGMAALVLNEKADFDLTEFRAHLCRNLPDYARPVFLRIREAIDVTGTFKMRKLDLVKEGFEPAGIADPLFIDHPTEKRFIRLDPALADAVRSKALRL
jgi:fatty-acyl-CoA synthase